MGKKPSCIPSYPSPATGVGPRLELLSIISSPMSDLGVKAGEGCWLPVDPGVRGCGGIACWGGIDSLKDPVAMAPGGPGGRI